MRLFKEIAGSQFACLYYRERVWSWGAVVTVFASIYLGYLVHVYSL